jgi:hypothetical protein
MSAHTNKYRGTSACSCSSHPSNNHMASRLWGLRASTTLLGSRNARNAATVRMHMHSKADSGSSLLLVSAARNMGFNSHIYCGLAQPIVVRRSFARKVGGSSSSSSSRRSSVPVPVPEPPAPKVPLFTTVSTWHHLIIITFV